jgi:hypothetical protein
MADFKVGDKVKVIRSDRIGTVEKIFTNEDYPIQVNLGYGDVYTFKPYELKHIEIKEGKS